MPLHEAVERVMSGEFKDGKTIVGLLMASQFLAARDMPFAAARTPIQRVTGVPSSREAK